MGPLPDRLDLLPPTPSCIGQRNSLEPTNSEVDRVGALSPYEGQDPAPEFGFEFRLLNFY